MKKTFLTLLVTGALGMTAFADVVYVTSNTSNCTATAVCGSGANPDLNDPFFALDTIGRT